MKTTLDLPDAILNELERRAQRDGRKLDDAVAELLRNGLALSEQRSVSAQKPVIKSHPQSGLPYIECPADAPARSMTLRDLVALEHQILDREDGERAGLPA